MFYGIECFFVLDWRGLNGGYLQYERRWNKNKPMPENYPHPYGMAPLSMTKQSFSIVSRG
jgi:hypothetical protein